MMLVLVFTSCSDFLEIKPREDVSIQQQFSTQEGVLQALNGAYVKTEDLMSSNAFIYADLQGGNLSFIPIQSGTSLNAIIVPSSLLNVYNFNDNATESTYSAFYQDAYKTLANINNVIAFTPNIGAMSTEKKSQILAEALALRAFIHYNLLQFYAQTYSFSNDASHSGIVYADRILQGGVDFESRKSVAVTYKLIKDDLDKALSLFTTSQAMSGPGYSYFNTTTTTALYARIALQSNDYDKASLFAKEAIKLSGLVLTPNANYIQEWEKPNLPISEVILEFTAPKDNSGQLVSSTVAGYYNSFGNTSSLFRLSASLDLIELYSPQDIRRNNFIEKNYTVNTVNGLQNRTFYNTKKFQDNAGTLSIRLSEMYLIIAEAKARLDQFEEAKSNLNMIRNRANLSNITSNDSLLEKIFLERRRELCFEGFLLFDVARFKKNTIKILDCYAFTCILNYPNPKFVLPIPQETISVNQNIKQNEGY
jgi:hypothetical protein